MRLKEALKKFNFLKKLDLPENVLSSAANQLMKLLEGNSEVYPTPLAKSCDPIDVLVDWDILFEERIHKMNSTLLDLEYSNRSKFGPRSIAVPWAERSASLKESFTNQDDNHAPKFFDLPGDGDLCAVSIEEATQAVKNDSSAGFPFLCKKGKVLPLLLENFDYYLDRRDPCALYTRTAEKGKTRNVWGFPFADTLYEMLFYIPILELQRTKYYRAALVSPDLVSERITEMILKAKASLRRIYSIDFKAFDTSVKYQYTVKAFEYFERCFAPVFGPLIRSVGERFYTIGIVTPIAVFRGKHGIPSGSTFTNEVDSVVQIGIALTNSFIREDECQIQGDDGVYIMSEENISDFEEAFQYAGLKLSKDKCSISSDYALYCQKLFHIDYLKDGLIGGIYPTYRAINRILFQERFVNFKRAKIKGKDYYAIRTLTILENCKHHPLFEDLVRFILEREKYSLDISADGLLNYCNLPAQDTSFAINGSHDFGLGANGIKGFESYKIAMRILSEDGFFDDRNTDIA